MSANCQITAGFELGCRDNTGGVKRAFILSGSIDTVNATDFLISGITGSGKFFAFDQVKQTANYTETINSSIENGTIFYQQDLTLQFHKYQDSLQNELNILGQNPELKIILETNNGATDNDAKFFLLGQQNGLTLSAGTGQTGTAFGDLNGYSLTFTSQEPEPAREIDVTFDSSVAFNNLTSSLDGIEVGYS
jgi:hypothetical protein